MKAYIISSSSVGNETVKQLLTKYKIEYFEPHIAISPSDIIQGHHTGFLKISGTPRLLIVSEVVNITEN